MDIIETDPSLPLQAAMVAALEADSALQTIFGASVNVFDRVDDDVFPFIRVGEDRVVPADLVCGSFSEVYSTVRIYSRAVGRVEAKRIAERVRFLLTKGNPSFTIAGFKLVSGFCERIDPIEHADGLTSQIAIEFKYRIQPVAP